MGREFVLETLESRCLLSGNLDPTFGAGGVVSGYTNVFPAAQSVVVQPDGRIVFAGGSGVSLAPAIVRMNSDGTPDASFGSNGQALLAGTPFEDALSVKLLPGGGMLVGGVSDGFLHIVVGCFNADGSIDSGFGNAGFVSSDLVASASFSYNERFAMEVQSDGKFIIGGLADSGAFGVQRFTSEGAPDAGFATRGELTFGNGLSELTALAVSDDGSIYAGGDDATSISILRLTSSGVVDDGFGSGGVAILTRQGGCQIRGLSVATDGSIVVGGNAMVSGGGTSVAVGMLAAKFTRAGNLDPRFGRRGVAIETFLDRGTPDPQHATKGGRASAMVVQPDGRIVLTGGVELPYQPSTHPALLEDFATVRLLPDGKPDTSFGPRGERTISSGNLWPSPVNEAYAAALAPDGTLIVAGGTGSSAYYNHFQGDAALVRLLPNGTVDRHFGYEGRAGAFPVAPPAEQAALTHDGKLVLADPSGISRLLPDGELDPSFGDRGLVLASTDDADAQRTGVFDLIEGVTVLPDEKVVELVDVESGTSTRLYVRRYTPSGRLDPTFGVHGTMPLPVGMKLSRIVLASLAVQKDGKVLVLGAFNYDAPTSFIARVTAEGRMDKSFGVGGVVKLGVYGTGIFTNIVLQPHGAIQLYGVGTHADFSGYASMATGDSILSRRLGSRGQSLGGPRLVPLNQSGDVLAVIPQTDGSDLLYSHDTGGFSVRRYKAGIPDGTGVLTLRLPSDFYSIPGFVAAMGSDALLASDGIRTAEVVAVDGSGSLDEGFGTQGVLTLQGDDLLGEVAMLPGADGSVTLVSSGYIVRIR